MPLCLWFALPWWWVILSTFSYTFWPFVFSFWTNVYSRSLPLIGYLFICLCYWVGFLMHFGYLPFIKYKVCKYFSQSIGCIFILLIVSYLGKMINLHIKFVSFTSWETLSTTSDISMLGGLATLPPLYRKLMNLECW